MARRRGGGGALGGPLVRRRLQRARPADPGRARLREPDGAGHRRVGAERRVRRRRRAPPRVRRPRRRARVLLQRHRSADGPLPGVRRRDPPRRGAAGGRLPGGVRRRARARGGRPGTADARADRSGARALPRALRHLRTREPRRGGDPRRAPRDRHVRVRRRALGANERPRRRSRPRRRALRRHDHVLRRGRRLHAAEVRAWVRPPRLRARRRPPRVRRAPPGAPRCSATRATRSRCSSISSSS